MISRPAFRRMLLSQPGVQLQVLEALAERVLGLVLELRAAFVPLECELDSRSSSSAYGIPDASKSFA